ncbi:MAG: nucleotide-binding domain containing protein, partial [Acetobacteraceae bacterium]
CSIRSRCRTPARSPPPPSPGSRRRAGRLAERADAARLPPARGRAAILAGSCSRATLGQVAFARERMPALMLDPLAMPDAGALAAAALAWIEAQGDDAPVLIAASDTPDRVAAVQSKLGREAAGALVETALATIAEALIARGVGRLIVAGGETSGAVVSRLGLTRLEIGPEIDPGVPWTFAPERGLHLALKSGNFGARDFFPKALSLIEEMP